MGSTELLVTTSHVHRCNRATLVFDAKHRTKVPNKVLGELWQYSAVITGEGVHNEAYKSAEAILIAFESKKFDGLDIFDGHPLLGFDGFLYDTKDVVGFTSDPVLVFDGDRPMVKVNMNFYMDNARFPMGRFIAQEVENGSRKEVSIGFHADVVFRNGEFDGVPFFVEETTILPEHLAILRPDEVGACSGDQGCGVLTNELRESRANGTVPKSNCGCGKHVEADDVPPPIDLSKVRITVTNTTDPEVMDGNSTEASASGGTNMEPEVTEPIVADATSDEAAAPPVATNDSNDVELTRLTVENSALAKENLLLKGQAKSTNERLSELEAKAANACSMVERYEANERKRLLPIIAQLAGEDHGFETRPLADIEEGIALLLKGRANAGVIDDVDYGGIAPGLGHLSEPASSNGVERNDRGGHRSAISLTKLVNQKRGGKNE